MANTFGDVLREIPRSMTKYPRRVRRRWDPRRSIGPLTAKDTTLSADAYATWLEQHTWAPSSECGLVIEAELSPAAWLLPRLAPGSFEVHMTSPEGYEAYARILFPFVGPSTRVGDSWAPEEHISWHALAARNGRAFHPLVEEETVNVCSDASDYRVSTSLAKEQLATLLPILGRHTSSSTGRFLLWEGYAELKRSVFDGFPTASHPMRNYYLLSGPLNAFGEFPEDPDYWWPDDRSWCLSGDTDFHWAYLAGSETCVNEVLDAPILDAVRTEPANPARFGMDQINRPPQG